MSIQPSSLLRKALMVDAAASGALGIVCLAGSSLLPGLLGLPHGFLMAVGSACLLWAAITGFAATRQVLPSVAVWAIIGLNAVWVLESIVLLFGWLQPTGLGTAFVVLQAIIVAILAELQFVGFKRSQAAATA
jgi:hypothetical protein